MSEHDEIIPMVVWIRVDDKQPPSPRMLVGDNFRVSEIGKDGVVQLVRLGRDVPETPA